MTLQYRSLGQSPVGRVPHKADTKACFIFFVGMLCSNTHADEYYNFYRINCDKQIPAFEIQQAPFWNITHLVWPNNSNWKSHVQSLKNLEKFSNLYVFDEFYGYYESVELSFICGVYHAKISYSKALREEGPVGSKEPVRMGAAITIISSGFPLAENLPLKSIQRLRVYSDYEHTNYIEVCGPQKCVDYFPSRMGEITSDNIESILNR